MKKTIASLAFAAAVLLPASAKAQASHADHGAKKEAEKDHHAMASGWKELDAFHTLMAATWHPVGKSNDFKPIREKAGALNDAAQAWNAAKVPAACDNKKNRDAIASVATGSKAIAAMVATNAADAEIKSALKELHDRFEVVEEGCKPHGKH